MPYPHPLRGVLPRVVPVRTAARAPAGRAPSGEPRRESPGRESPVGRAPSAAASAPPSVGGDPTGHRGAAGPGLPVEKSLSVEDLFVFMLSLSAYAVPAAPRQRVPLYGIIGALGPARRPDRPGLGGAEDVRRRLSPLRRPPHRGRRESAARRPARRRRAGRRELPERAIPPPLPAGHRGLPRTAADDARGRPTGVDATGPGQRRRAGLRRDLHGRFGPGGVSIRSRRCTASPATPTWCSPPMPSPC